MTKLVPQPPQWNLTRGEETIRRKDRKIKKGPVNAQKTDRNFSRVDECHQKYKLKHGKITNRN